MLAFDIDGTLAPIVDEPVGARISPTSVQRCLRALDASIRRSRSSPDVRSPTRGGCWASSPRYLVGNHGAEGVPGSTRASAGFRASLCGAGAPSSALRRRARWRAWPGVLLEDKRYSLAFHYRRAAEPALARRDARARSAATGSRAAHRPGKCVLNLLPPGRAAQGRGAASLLGRLRLRRVPSMSATTSPTRTCFALRLPDVLSVRVERKAATVPRPVPARINPRCAAGAPAGRDDRRGMTSITAAVASPLYAMSVVVGERRRISTSGVIGNCAFNALIDERGRVVWCCLPRPDGDPVFHALLGGAERRVATAGLRHRDRRLRVARRSATFPTPPSSSPSWSTEHGSGVRITDFAPRFTRSRPHVPAAAAGAAHRAVSRATARSACACGPASSTARRRPDAHARQQSRPLRPCRRRRCG